MLGRPYVSQYASPLACSQTIVRLLIHLYPLSNSFIAFKTGAGLCVRLFNSTQVSDGSRGGAGGPAPPPAYFQTKLRLVPHYLRVWMTTPPPSPLLSEGLDPPL